MNTLAVEDLAHGDPGMTHADLDELKRLLAAYRSALQTRHGVTIARKRMALETALVRRADALIAGAEACLAFVRDTDSAPPLLQRINQGEEA